MADFDQPPTPDEIPALLAQGFVRLPNPCAWCGGPVYSKRADKATCCKAHRQAKARAKVAHAQVVAHNAPARLAIADPPYPGKASYYSDQESYGGEVDHRELLSRLATYDGWALHTSADAIPLVTGLAHELGIGYRLAVWTRAPRPHASAAVLNAFEPILFRPARRAVGQPLDVIADVTPRRRPTLPGAVIGMKPPLVCERVFQLLGAAVGDDLDDLFPGSGIVTSSWRRFVGEDLSTGQASLLPGPPGGDDVSLGTGAARPLEAA